MLIYCAYFSFQHTYYIAYIKRNVPFIVFESTCLMYQTILCIPFLLKRFNPSENSKITVKIVLITLEKPSRSHKNLDPTRILNSRSHRLLTESLCIFLGYILSNVGDYILKFFTTMFE